MVAKRHLIAFALLTLAACTVPAPKPPPEVVISGYRPEQLVPAFAAIVEANGKIEREHPRDVTRLHTVLEQTADRVVVKSENADAFHRPGYLKLYFRFSGALGTGTRVTLGVNYIQNPGGSFEREVSIYDAAEVVNPQGFIDSYAKVLESLRDQLIVQAGGKPPVSPATAAQDYEWRQVNVEWEGFAGPLVGKVGLPKNSTTGKISVVLPGVQGQCDGASQALDNTRGSWWVACPNGLAANGMFFANGVPGQSKGEGRDNQGRAIRYTLAPRS